MNISPRDRTLLAGVAAIAALAAFYLLAFKPQIDRAAQLGQSVASAQQTLVTAQRQYAAGRVAQQRLAATRTDYAAAQRAVPVQANIPGLLRLLQRAADAAHVSIQSISLSGSSSSAASTTTPTTPATTGTSTAAASAQTVPVSLTFSGGYQALNRMVERLDGFVAVSHGGLRSHGPLIGISSVSLNQASDQSKQISVALDTTIYQYAATSSTAGATSGAAS